MNDSQEIDYNKPITVKRSPSSPSEYYNLVRFMWSVMLNGEDISKQQYDTWAKACNLDQTFPSHRLFSSCLQPARSMLHGNEHLHTKQVASWMRMVGHTVGMFWGNDNDLCQKLNNRLFTHNKDGSLNRVRAADVRGLFEAGHEKDWPELFLTSNHAMAADHHDISGIMRGFRKLAQDTFGEKVKLLRHISGGDALKAEEAAVNGDGKKAVIITAVHAEKSVWFNGAELIDRIDELKRNKDSDKHVSPAARRLCKLMLSLMVEDPSRIDMDATGLVKVNAADEPIVLREDAIKIAQHINLEGYSKGGNVVTDAMRLMVKELRQQHHSAPLFEMRQNDKTVPMKKPQIAGLLRHIGVLGVSTGEVALTDEEKAYGIRRTTIINEHDVIAGHFHIHRKTHYGGHDDFHRIEGDKNGMGHEPKDALGYYEDGQEEKRGYLHKNEAVHDLLKSFFAASFDKVAFSDIRFDKVRGKTGKYHISLEFAPGVSIADIQAKEEVIREVFQEAGLEGVGLSCDIRTRECSVVINNEKAMKLDGDLLDKMATALESITDPDVVISRAVHVEIDEMRKQLNQGKKTHLERTQEPMGSRSRAVS